MGKSLVFYIFGYWNDPRWKEFVGATVKLRDLADNLSQCGHEVLLFLPQYGFKSNNLSFTIRQIPLLDLPLLRRVTFSAYLFVTLLLTRKKPDVVYMRRMGSIIPALFARIRGSALFFEVNDDPYFKVHRRGPAWLFKIRSSLSVLQDEMNVKLSDISFVITPEVREKLTDRIPSIIPEKIIISPSGANTSLFKPMLAHNCRLDIGLDPNLKYIGFVGTLLDHQGIHTLIDAAPKIIQENPQCRFLIIGEGPMKTHWQRRALANGVQGDFVFTGQIDYEKVPLWINSMDVCVAPYTRSAGLRSPVKIFDYLSCSKPVVASLLPGTTESFVKSDAVCLVTPEDADQLAHAVIGLLQNPEKADQMGRNGREFIVKHFDRMTNARRVIDTVARNRSPN